MKKILRIAATAIGSIILLMVVAAIALPILIPAEKVKDFAAQKISETLNRTVSVEGASFNIFEGIKLKGIYIGNNKKFSDKPFVRAESFNLKYAFWPLFTGKILIHEIELVKPEVLVEKDANGKSSLEDLTKNTAKGNIKTEKKTKEDKKKKIDLIVNNISIKNGRLTYHDYLTGTNELKNLNLKISNLTLALVKPIEIRAGATASYQKKDIPVSINAKIKPDPSFDAVSIPLLSVKIAGESFSCPIEIKKIKAGPEAEFRLSSDNLSIDTLLGILGTGAKTPAAKPKPGALTKSLKASVKSIPDSLKISGKIDIKNAVFQKLKLDRFNADISVSGKKIWLKLNDLSGYGGKLSMDSRINLSSLSYAVKPLNLKGFNAAPFINDFIDSFTPQLLNMKDRAEGTLDVFFSVSGQGIEMPDVFDNAKIDGVVVLAKGRLKKIKSLENIAEKYNLSFLKHDILVKGLRTEGALNGKILTVKELDLRDTDMEIGFTGGLDFNKMDYQAGNRLTIKLSPDASKGLPGEFSIFKDDRGFVTVDFELLGSLYAPIPSPRLEKPIEKTVGKIKVKIEAKKLELEQKAKEQIGEEGEKAKKKAEEKIKEILRF